jgi:hypothetical protein
MNFQVPPERPVSGIVGGRTLPEWWESFTDKSLALWHQHRHCLRCHNLFERVMSTSLDCLGLNDDGALSLPYCRVVLSIHLLCRRAVKHGRRVCESVALD